VVSEASPNNHSCDSSLDFLDILTKSNGTRVKDDAAELKDWPNIYFIQSGENIGVVSLKKF
jgi:hypothetical protein